eukprot:scaffold8628_cov149-Amphora_coffeaeformis.AAC.6
MFKSSRNGPAACKKHCWLKSRRLRPKSRVLLNLACLAVTRGFSSKRLLARIQRDSSLLLEPSRALENALNNSPQKQQQQQHVRFISPLLEYGYPPAVSEFTTGALQEKPLLLYLPGFDGSFLSPFLQFPELHEIFDVRCMTVAVEDRSTIHDLKASVMTFLRDTVVENDTTQQNVNATKTTKQKRKKNSTKSRPFYIAGESFGGILACEIAVDLCQDESFAFQGLTLVNPATCYYRSRLAIEGPIVAASNPLLYYFNLLRLLPLFTDDYSLDQLVMILSGEALPSVIDDAMREAYLGRVAFSLPLILPIMKQKTLQWRLSEWLEKGSATVDNKLEQVAQQESLRILLVVGENDGALPSISEAERLAGIWGPKQLTIHVVEGAGHASTCGSRVDLAALFRKAFPRLRRQKKKQKKLNSGLRWPPWSKATDELQVPHKTPSAPRTAMKPMAANGTGKYLGMEPRYDNATIGLSPLEYWSPAYYQKLTIQNDGTGR